MRSPYRAIVIGATGGIGAALVAQIATKATVVHALARRPVAGGINVVPGLIDITDESTIVAARDSIGEGDPVRLIVVATGVLHDATLQPEKTLKALDADRLARAFAVNAIGPALVAKHMMALLPRDGKSVFVMISARVGSISDNRLGGWYGYRASKAALNQIARTLAIEIARTKPEAIITTMHPGTVDTHLSAPFRGGIDPERMFTPEDAAGHMLNVIDGLTASDSGGFFAWNGQRIPF